MWLLFYAGSQATGIGNFFVVPFQYVWTCFLKGWFSIRCCPSFFGTSLCTHEKHIPLRIYIHTSFPGTSTAATCLPCPRPTSAASSAPIRAASSGRTLTTSGGRACPRRPTPTGRRAPSGHRPKTPGTNCIILFLFRQKHYRINFLSRKVDKA
jgi:hypothetical protein